MLICIDYILLPAIWIGDQQMRVLSILTCTILALMISGCSLFKENPYADFMVGEINETDPQTPAVILVGDPQVSSRESLINDRMREVDHLEQMIRDSKAESVSFEPQLKRDLRVIQALAAQLGISFNPAAGAAFGRQEDLDKLHTDVKIVKLRNELERIKKLSQTSPVNGPNQGTNQGGSQTDQGNPGAGQEDSQSGPSDSSLEELKAQLNKAVTAANNLLGELQKTISAGRAAGADIKNSPEDRFEDLNAYRARLRQRQNEVRLDDVHDANGYALYRLQLTAAVLPGKVKNKFAVLDAEIDPVEATDDEIRALYDQWLVELSQRGLRFALSSTSGFSRNHARWERLQTELIRAKLVERVLFKVPASGDPGSTFTMVLFTYPGEDSEAIMDMLDKKYRDVLPKVIEDLERISKGNNKLEFVSNGNSCTVKKTNGEEQTVTINNNIYKYAKAVVDSAASISAIEVFLSSLIAAGDSSGVAPRYTKKILETLEEAYTTAQDVLKKMKSLGNGNKCFQRRVATVPTEFRNKVCDDNRNWRGEARTYQAQPTERVQRISSVASAVNSMQLAFSLAALLPGQGLGLNAGAAAAKTAIGMVETIERTPIVIGYTDRQPKSSARFGYIFGPKAVLNTKANQLEYRQIARNHPVFADITVPAWWPAIDLKVRSAWAENWHEGTKVLRDSTNVSNNHTADRSIRVQLPPRLADVDSLTEFILRNPIVSGFDVPRITEVYPERVSSCAGDVVFTIAGENLWRSPVVYLGGKRHKSITVLPDMRGLAVTFNMSDLPKPPSRGTKGTPITVWTSLGSDSENVDIVDTRLGKLCPDIARAGGVAVSFSPDSTRLVGGKESKIRVRMTKPLPKAARKVKVIYQFLANQVLYQKHHIEDTKVYYGKFAEGSATVSKPENIPDEKANGMPLRVGLQYQTIDGGAYHPFWAEYTMVFYVNEEASKFTIEKISSSEGEKIYYEKGKGDISKVKIDSLPIKVVFTPPVKLEEGYPDFASDKDKKDNFVAAVVGDDKIKLKVTDKWNDENHPGKAVVLIRPEDPAVWEQKACKSVTKLIISASDTSGQSPLVHSGAVTIKQKTDGCNEHN